jgi:hypothetical protein
MPHRSLFDRLDDRRFIVRGLVDAGRDRPIRISAAGNGRIRSDGSGSSLSQRVSSGGARIAGMRSWISATILFASVVITANVLIHSPLNVAFDEGPFQNDSGVPQGPTRVFAACSPSKSHRLQEVYVMTWSDSPWVLMYSILVTLLIVLWAYVPA